MPAYRANQILCQSRFSECHFEERLLLVFIPWHTFCHDWITIPRWQERPGLDARSGMPCVARLGHRRCEETARQAITGIAAIYIDKCGMVHDTAFLSMIITLKRSVSKYPTNERHWLIVNRGQICIWLFLLTNPSGAIRLFVPTSKAIEEVV